MTSAVTDEQKFKEKQMIDEKRCRDALKALPEATRNQIIAHLINAQSDEINRLMTSPDPVRIHRAQGATSAIQSVIDLLVVS